MAQHCSRLDLRLTQNCGQHQAAPPTDITSCTFRHLLTQLLHDSSRNTLHSTLNAPEVWLLPRFPIQDGFSHFIVLPPESRTSAVQSFLAPDTSSRRIQITVKRQCSSSISDSKTQDTLESLSVPLFQIGNPMVARIPKLSSRSLRWPPWLPSQSQQLFLSNIQLAPQPPRNRAQRAQLIHVLIRARLTQPRRELPIDTTGE